MSASWRDRTLLDLLTEHGLELAPEHAFPTDGWSGATFTSLFDHDGKRFILKRTSMASDWIARATLDHSLREAWVASRPHDGVSFVAAGTIPYLGAAADGVGAAILMPDLSTELIAWERPGHDPDIDVTTVGRVLEAIVRLHAMPWSTGVEWTAEREGDAAPPWCPLPERLTLLSPVSAAGYEAEGNPVGDRFLAGWDAFRGRAPGEARDLVDRLSADVSPLVSALDRLPTVGLHGDLKLANVALTADDRVALIDWQMTTRAPVAVEMGWFLVSNSGSLPGEPEQVMSAYRDALRAVVRDRSGFGERLNDFAGLAGDWAVQLDLTWIVGLLLRGWRKGLDARAGVVLPSGVTAADDLTWWSERAADAAARCL